MKSPTLTRITWIGAILCAFSCLQPDETPHASSHRNALPVLGNHSCLFVCYAAGLGAVVTGVCVCILGTKQKELLARIHTFSKRWKSFSHLLLKTCGVWGGNDWDSGKTPAFISSSASQELFECAGSAILCVIQPPPSVSSRLAFVFTATFISGFYKLSLHLCIIYRQEVMVSQRS